MKRFIQFFAIILSMLTMFACAVLACAFLWPVITRAIDNVEDKGKRVFGEESQPPAWSHTMPPPASPTPSPVPTASTAERAVMVIFGEQPNQKAIYLAESDRQVIIQFGPHWYAEESVWGEGKTTGTLLRVRRGK